MWLDRNEICATPSHMIWNIWHLRKVGSTWAKRRRPCARSDLNHREGKTRRKRHWVFFFYYIFNRQTFVMPSLHKIPSHLPGNERQEPKNKTRPNPGRPLKSASRSFQSKTISPLASLPSSERRRIFEVSSDFSFFFI